MCGIIGYNGNNSAKEIILDGLFSLEYRGYDSAGFSLLKNGNFTTCKCNGRVSSLKDLSKHITNSFSCGIGHTRWATHGKPSFENAHPHASDNCVVVHNGIIENYLDLKKTLIECGYEFKSDTDTECIAHLVDYEYKKTKDTFLSIKNATEKLIGSYAIAVMFSDNNETIWATRKDNPLIVAKCEDGCYLASDITALLDYTNQIIRPEDGEILELSKTNILIYDKDKKIVNRKEESISWGVDKAQKGGFDHFMLKEIFEQPTAIYNAVKPLLKNGLPDIEKIDLKEFDSVSIIACGSATHAGLVGKYVIEKIAKIPVFVTTASEYRYSPPVTIGKTLCIPISQSGETADTLAALRVAKEHGDLSLGIINTVGSGIARETDFVIYTNAGPEIAVATTKGYTTQLAVLTVLAVAFGISKGKIDKKTAERYCDSLLNDIPICIEQILNKTDDIKDIAKEIYNNNDIYFIGRGIDYYASVESSLKLKEISYIHSESYAAGELKHGTLSLIEKRTPVIAICSDVKYYQKMIGNIKEVSARGGKVIFLCKSEFPGYNEYCDKAFLIPDTSEFLSPILSAVFSQLLAYYVALYRDCDIDHPRNLAKSVTVE